MPKKKLNNNNDSQHTIDHKPANKNHHYTAKLCDIIQM